MCDTLQQESEDTVCLDVGGTIFKTRRKTFTAHPDSMLGRMLSLDQKIGLKTDANGNYFFDNDAISFRKVMQYYKTGILPESESVAENSELSYWCVPFEEFIPNLQTRLYNPITYDKIVCEFPDNLAKAETGYCSFRNEMGAMQSRDFTREVYRIPIWKTFPLQEKKEYGSKGLENFPNPDLIESVIVEWDHNKEESYYINTQNFEMSIGFLDKNEWDGGIQKLNAQYVVSKGTTISNSMFTDYNTCRILLLRATEKDTLQIIPGLSNERFQGYHLQQDLQHKTTDVWKPCVTFSSMGQTLMISPMRFIFKYVSN